MVASAKYMLELPPRPLRAPSPRELLQVPAGRAPGRKGDFDAFWLDSLPVTNEDYARFLAATRLPRAEPYLGWPMLLAMRLRPPGPGNGGA